MNLLPWHWKAIGGVIAAGMLFAVWSYHRGVVKDRNEARAELATICNTVRTVTAKPKLPCSGVVFEVTAMAGNVSRCEAALEKQGEAVDNLKREGAMQQEQAERAVKRAETRAKRAENAAEQFSDAMRDGSGDANCLSPQLQKAWPGAER